MLSLGSYSIGCILLGGLFFYDIFWVFGTDVMVTGIFPFFSLFKTLLKLLVAKSFDAPIKLLFPKDIFAEVFEFSMLGLGDIVIPGSISFFILRDSFAICF